MNTKLKAVCGYSYFLVVGDIGGVNTHLRLKDSMISTWCSSPVDWTV
ncbi:hypothetical protein LDK94_12045 [Staphylococcus arlettae]|nr:hypothetical protein [Staphylococcus arlettae]MCD9056016.1 hypothetical protein [Staphylococcus arlettae]